MRYPLRYPLRSFWLLMGVLLMAGILIVGDVFAAPSHAVSRRAPAGGAPSATAKARRTATIKDRKVRVARSNRRVARQAAPAPAPAAGDVWGALRQCESGGRYDINTGNGYYGAYQFLVSTWNRLGYPGYPHEAPPAMQDEAAQKPQAQSGWGQWPACARRLGLR
ncbi:MAG: transglycosylase family protein [Acidimicrobiia bacterium]